ncbi:MAG TPA: TetR/AcrR family transcriptional regulator [Selenomonadales bacterium]|nr:TetR/AcrR family transcriptional regulator [Selenomonadales bacterium]
MPIQPPHKTTDTKYKILRAAAQIINTTGVTALTLEAVAKEAKLSKGGLLYHFPSKDALMKGMSDFVLQGFIDKVEHIAGQDQREKGKWTRAYANVTFSQPDDELTMNVAFLSAIAANPEMLLSVSKQMQQLQKRIENDHMDPTLSTVIRLAVDGLYYNQLYRINLREEVREKVLNYLISLTGEETL